MFLSHRLPIASLVATILLALLPVGTARADAVSAQEEMPPRTGTPHDRADAVSAQEEMPPRTGTPHDRAIARAEEVDGWNDLFAAVVDNDLARVRSLHDAGASVLLRDRYDRSLLDVARAYELDDMAALLRKLGAVGSVAKAVGSPTPHDVVAAAGTAKSPADPKPKEEPRKPTVGDSSQDAGSGVIVTHSGPAVVLMVGLTTATLKTWTDKTVSPDAYCIERDERIETSRKDGLQKKKGTFFLCFPGHLERIRLTEMDSADYHAGMFQDLHLSWLAPGKILQMWSSSEQNASGRYEEETNSLFLVTADRLRPLGLFSQTTSGKIGSRHHFGGGQEFEFDAERNELVVRVKDWEDYLEDTDPERTPPPMMANGFDAKSGTVYVFRHARTDYRFRLVVAGLEPVGGVARLLHPKEMLLLDIAGYYKTTVHELHRLNPGLTTFYADGEDVVVSDHVEPLKPGLTGDDRDNED